VAVSAWDARVLVEKADALVGGVLRAVLIDRTR